MRQRQSRGLKMRIALIVFLLFLCLGFPMAAEKSALAIPSLDRTALSVATGEAGAFLSGLDSLGKNPAGLCGTTREWNATHRQMPLETSVSGTAIRLPLASFHSTLAVSYTVLRSANLEGRTAAGDRVGDFQQEDQMMGVHLARPFVVGGYEIEAGASVKGIHSRIDRYSGTGLAVDLGLRHHFKEIPLTVGVSELNMGEGPKLMNERSALPTSFGISASYAVAPSVFLFGGASYQSGQDILTFSAGGEYQIGHLFALRGNYAAGSGAEGNSGVGQLVGGFGVILGKCRLDYAFQPAGEELAQAGAPATQHATLTLDF